MPSRKVRRHGKSGTVNGSSSPFVLTINPAEVTERDTTEEK
nr:hypothetical protein Iba_chr02cCG0740 [Ipomoea batatas]